jgi:hypothetical protein
MALVETPKSPIVKAVQLMVVLTAGLWLIEVVDVLIFDSGLDEQGIVPRTWSGLDGVLWAPFLHGGFGHLLANTLPLLVLGGFVALGGMRRWVAVTAFVVITGGLATWLVARPAIHIGASGLIFGYAGFLLSGCAEETELAEQWLPFTVPTVQQLIRQGRFDAEAEEDQDTRSRGLAAAARRVHARLYRDAQEAEFRAAQGRPRPPHLPDGSHGVHPR